MSKIFGNKLRGGLFLSALAIAPVAMAQYQHMPASTLQVRYEDAFKPGFNRPKWDLGHLVAWKFDTSPSDKSENLALLDSDGKVVGTTRIWLPDASFLRIEDADSKQSFLPSLPDQDALESPTAEEDIDSAHTSGSESPKDSKKSKQKIYNGGSRIKRALKNLSSGTHSGMTTPRSTSPTVVERSTHQANGFTVVTPPPTSRRVLYSANAGDARGVLCRAGKAVRLTYDHKGSDKQEAKRITDAGGFVMSGRVNGVLAVTRSLGDSSMKEFVVGSPYTTETELCEEDELLILACDGVSNL